MTKHPNIGLPLEVLRSHSGANDTSNGSKSFTKSKYHLRSVRAVSFAHFFKRMKPQQQQAQSRVVDTEQHRQQAQPIQRIIRRCTVSLVRYHHQQQPQINTSRATTIKQQPPQNITTRRVTVSLTPIQHQQIQPPHNITIQHQLIQPPHNIITRRFTVSLAKQQNQKLQPRRRLTVNVPRQFVEISQNKFSSKAYSTLKPNTKHNLSNLMGCDTVVKRTEGSGEGLFANQMINSKKFIGELVGYVITNEEQWHRVANGISSGKYSISLNRSLVLDTEHMGNSIRKVNHSCGPNAVFVSCIVNGLPHIRLYALQRIRNGEEITVSYGKSYLGFELTCMCGKERCRGVIGI